MNATEAIADDMTADVQLVADCFVAGIPVPPDAARRIHERAAQVRQQILKEQGVRDVGVQIIRELRGEQPAP